MGSEASQRTNQVGVVIVAAGESQRMLGVDKSFAPVLGIPLLLHSLQVFPNSSLVDHITITLSKANLQRGHSLLNVYGWGKVRALCPGGASRRDSVALGLRALPPTNWVLVHDGARPVIDEAILSRGLSAAEATGAAVPIVTSVDAIKYHNPEGTIISTLPTETIGLAQTPQVFQTAILLEAHERCIGSFTDDASMVESLGYEVKTFPGSRTNIKVTTREDLVLVEALLSADDMPTIT